MRLKSEFLCVGVFLGIISASLALPSEETGDAPPAPLPSTTPESLSTTSIPSTSPPPGAFAYPPVRRDETVVDNYHGTNISDPYRWLEDPDSEETQKFVKAQNNLTFSYLNSAPYRKELKDALTEIWNYPKRGLPKKRGEKYYFFANTGLQNQYVLMEQDTLESEPRVFFDPNELSEDGTVSIKSSAFSEDGQLWAYALSQSGADWVTVRIKNVTTREDYPETLGPTKWPSISWTHDNLGFFYSQYEKTSDKNQTGTETDETGQEKIYYHKVGTKQEEDKLVLEFPDRPKLSLSIDISEDGEYMIVYTYEVINEEFIHIASLKPLLESDFKNKLELIEINTEPGSFTYVTNDEGLFYFLTDLDAPNNKLIRLDLNKPGKKYWSTVVPEADEVLDWVTPINNDMAFTSYTKDVKSTLELRHLYNGSLITEYPLEIGSIGGTSGRREHSLFFFKLSTFTSPGVSYKIDFSKDYTKPEVFHKTLSKVNASDFKVEQVFYKSKDGTKIPMYILQPADLNKTGSAPAYLYSYGGFSSGQEPSYSTSYIVFVKHFKGVVAIPSIRGGGEYGKEWWDNGRLFKKQNCFDDFAAAGEYLIKNNYTSASKLTISGASNGGLLVAATTNQRPELFGAAIPEVGVMDMLRFQKFTVGFYWCGEYGCSENKTHFDNLITYSPLHNIREPKNGQYPAVLVKTADHDDRVVPLHSYKYIAELQHTIGHNKKQTNPLLIRIEEKAGHGGGTPTSKVIDEIVDDYAFLAKSLNLTFYDN